MSNKTLKHRRAKQMIISRLNNRFGAFKAYPLVWQNLVKRVFIETQGTWEFSDKEVIYYSLDHAIAKVLYEDRKFIALSIIAKDSDLRPFTYRKFVHWAKSCKPGSNILMLERKTNKSIVAALTQDSNAIKTTLSTFAEIAPALLQLLGDKVKLTPEYETCMMRVEIDYLTTSDDFPYLCKYFNRTNEGVIIPRFYMSESVNILELM